LIAAIFSIVAFESGENAEDVVEELADVSNNVFENMDTLPKSLLDDDRYGSQWLGRSNIL